jgi:kinesin family protein 18/19
MRFDYVFTERETQEDVYNFMFNDLLGNLFNGNSATVFAYGATGSGKTHTYVSPVNTR